MMPSSGDREKVKKTNGLIIRVLLIEDHTVLSIFNTLLLPPVNDGGNTELDLYPIVNNTTWLQVILPCSLWTGLWSSYFFPRQRACSQANSHALDWFQAVLSTHPTWLHVAFNLSPHSLLRSRSGRSQASSTPSSLRDSGQSGCEWDYSSRSLKLIEA